jgi:ABC-2 type transport system permease protein
VSWRAIARKDVRDSIRSRTLWAMIGIFLALILLLSWFATDGSAEGTFLAAAGFTFLLGVLFFVPLAGLLLSVKSIVRERNTGTINLLLSLPHTRGEMLLGKFVGRSIVMAATVVAGFVPALLFILVQVDGAPVFDLVTFLLAISVFGVMWIGIGIGLSALVNSETQATIAGVVIFFVLFLWPFILDQLGINLPNFAARFWVFAIFADLFFLPTVIRDGNFAFPSVVELDEILVEELNDVAISVAPHLQMWFVTVLVVFWIVFPLGAGYYRFTSSDL